MSGDIVLCPVLFCLPFSFILSLVSGFETFSLYLLCTVCFLSTLCHNGICLVILVV